MGELKEIRKGPADHAGSRPVSATTTIPRAAEMMGISRNLAYSVVARDGMLAGVRVIHAGRRLLIPTVPFLEALGLDAGKPTEPEGARSRVLR